jgi:peptide methionine sulfoxide reductase MsrB
MAKSYNTLTQAEARVILKKGTEYPGTGEYTNNKDQGTYICRQCNLPLYRSDRCGWRAHRDPVHELRRAPWTCLLG